jgi:hypothetical protein
MLLAAGAGGGVGMGGMFRQNSVAGFGELPGGAGAGGAPVAGNMGDLVQQGSFNWSTMPGLGLAGRPGELARSDTEMSFNMGTW